MNDEQTVRLECVRLAIVQGRSAEDVVASAKLWAAFVLGEPMEAGSDGLPVEKAA
jgi:hypothetical protein